MLPWWWSLVTNTEWMGSPIHKDRHTLPPKVKGRKEGVEDAVEEATSDGIPEHEIALTNSLGGTVAIESPSRVWEGRTLSGGLGMQGQWHQLVQ